MASKINSAVSFGDLASPIGSVAQQRLGEFCCLGWDAVDDVDKLFKELKVKGVKFSTEPKIMSWDRELHILAIQTATFG